MGRRPAVLGAALDGRERWVVADSGLEMPCGLALDFPQERVFWSDSRTRALESANLDGSERRLLTENEVGEVSVEHTHVHTCTHTHAHTHL